jgi:hypothetical protein
VYGSDSSNIFGKRTENTWEYSTALGIKVPIFPRVYIVPEIGARYFLNPIFDDLRNSNKYYSIQGTISFVFHFFSKPN